MIIVAVKVLEIDPIWKIESGRTWIPVLRFSTPEA
jgi:hypothetical protein